MKTYNEMASSALYRIKEYERIKRNRKKVIIHATVPALCGCLAILLAVGAWQAGRLDRFFTTQHTLQNDITGTEGKDETVIAAEDIIAINQIGSVSSDRMKMNIALLNDDFVEMSVLELNEYYGMDIFPTVPPDLTNWVDLGEFGGYGIYRRNKGTGDVYWDGNVLNYSNKDMTRNVNVEMAKNKIPCMDFGFLSQEDVKISTISGNDVFINRNAAGYYQAKFICNNTGFVVTTDGLSQEEVVAVIKSIIE